MNKPFAVTLDQGTSRANHTGSWRSRRPEYVDRLPPCNQACPAGEDARGWLHAAETGDYRAAWDALVVENPFPAVMGRACYHPCERACNRAGLDEAVGIHAVERFLGDLAIREGWKLPAPAAAASGKGVLVVGAGPAGLSAAYQLARMGHAVVVRDGLPLPGGMMRYGIPRYRLPRDVVDAEIARIVALGVIVEANRPVTDVARTIAEEGFDACFLAVGAHVAHRTAIPGGDAGRVLDALALLERVERGERPLLGRRVAVYGGGDTALDAARTAKRLGAEDAVVVYRRIRATMPAHPSEVLEAQDEGIRMQWLRGVRAFDGHALQVERMRLEDGRAVGTGELETLDADTLVLAIGQDADLSALQGLAGVQVDHGAVVVDAGMMTGHRGVFAGGDMVAGERTIAAAVGHGSRAARPIGAYLSGRPQEQRPARELATYGMLNPWYYSDADRTVQPTLERARRTSTFAEIHLGLAPDDALFEARRCLSCGGCFECDNCYGVCPDNAVVKLGPDKGFRIDLDFCKGCGLCASECPCGAIRMVAEPE